MKLYNTLSRRAEEFHPGGDTVLLYVCGLTPYDEPHAGHAMSAVVFDVLRRYLEFRGLSVRHVQNFTDIDDRIIQRANRAGVDTGTLVGQYVESYLRDLRTLNVLPAHHYPRVTEEVPAIVEMIQGLLERGYAYGVDGDVYYRVTRKPDYGRLSHRALESMVAGARVDSDERKEHPGDFALWKAAKPGEPAWPSPWGPGRPGWHIECSAMALRYLGATLDIHGGGADLIFPHHENEIAQSEAYTGKPFARWWVHNGWMLLNGEKMSKSLGNTVGMREAIERYGADAFRLFVLTSHYRSPLNFTDEALRSMRRGVQRLASAANAELPGRGEPFDSEPFRRRFIEAMDDDLGTPGAVAVLFELAHAVHRGRDAGQDVRAAQATLRELASVLGLALAAEAEEEAAADAVPFIELLLEVRQELRALRQFTVADKIRGRLSELGIAVEDTPEGSRWRPVRE